jgi:rhomboid protease GluP
MKDTSQNAILCPNCRKLISADEARCPHCGTRRPGSKLKNNMLVRLFHDPARFIKTIIFVNVGMFVISILLSSDMMNLSPNPLRFLSPDTRSLLLLGATGVIPIDRLHRWWSLLSANYLHGGILHIFFNMVAFRQIAGLIVQLYGVHRMFVLFTFGGMIGFLVSYLATANNVTASPVGLTIGSSAAVCSLIGAALYYGKSRGGVFGNMIYRQIGGWALAIFIFGFLVPGIDNWGHGGGIAAGIAIGFIIGYQEIKRENRLHKILAYLSAVSTAAVLLLAVFSGIYYL